jgi:enoyl-CoA hydratase
MSETHDAAEGAAYETIKVETSGRVGVVHLHRPKSLNALNAQLSLELLQALRAFDADPEDRKSVV